MEMKYKFDIVDIEITRKCQIKCKHCCRGDAQNVDMSEEIMEKFISQCDSINYLTFTGGEPFCNIVTDCMSCPQTALLSCPPTAQISVQKTDCCAGRKNLPAFAI